MSTISTDTRSLRMVALGGGHGLQATLRALRRLTPEVTAIVTVADDGGSSGRLRSELGALPPGDLRKALVALASDRDEDELWSSVLQHRFSGNGPLAGHAVGNLLIAGLFEVLGDPVAALDEVCRLIGIRGRVLPMCSVPLDIVADVAGVDGDATTIHQVCGQVAVATTPGTVQRIQLRADQPGPLLACPQAVAAIMAADVVVLGPGSWFTSVLPHLSVPQLHEALIQTDARKVVVLNLVPQPGETEGFSPELHLDVLGKHAPTLRIDAVLADIDAVPEPRRLHEAAAVLGATANLARIAADEAKDRHDPTALAAGLRAVLSDYGLVSVDDNVIDEKSAGGLRWR